MCLFRCVAASLLSILSLCFTILSNAEMVDIPVYKGELRFIVPDTQPRNSLGIQYRSKTREVVRIAIQDLTLTNMRTKQAIRLDAQSASLENLIDQAGYWNTDIRYNGLNLGEDDYRIQGRLSLYLIGSQRTSSFSAYLNPRAGRRPENSSIDWGLSE